MKTYQSKVNRFVLMSASARILILAIMALMISIIPLLVNWAISDFAFALPLVSLMNKMSKIILAIGIAFLALSAIIKVTTPNTLRICRMVRHGLFEPSRGNPLHLRDGDLLPRIRCKRVREGQYDLTISAQESVTVEGISNAAPAISGALNRRFQRYAITRTDPDIAYNGVTFRLEDVKVDQSLIFKNVEQMHPQSPTLLRVDKATNIDLTTSGSVVVAGKTRSGKTTGIISLLIQVLLCGRDDFGSEIIIIDPKQAELSMIARTVTLDANGEARAILNALRNYASTITQRQQILNNLSEQKGDAVKWWNAGFHPSFLFIDEFVSCRTLFPRKAAKDDDYCLDTFDSLLKRIVTMGASAGCFAIISIAEASVQEGGLPAMLRSAMSTRVLFRPTMAEGRLLWETDKLTNFPAGRVYAPGDAWFSSTDGIHDAVSCVHFPRLDFPVYGELRRLLKQYYGDK